LSASASGSACKMAAIDPSHRRQNDFVTKLALSLSLSLSLSLLYPSTYSLSLSLFLSLPPARARTRSISPSLPPVARPPARPPPPPHRRAPTAPSISRSRSPARSFGRPTSGSRPRSILAEITSAVRLRRASDERTTLRATARRSNRAEIPSRGGFKRFRIGRPRRPRVIFATIAARPQPPSALRHAVPAKNGAPLFDNRIAPHSYRLPGAINFQPPS